MPSITVTERVYERLKARKRTLESYTDLIDRLLDETTTDWRTTFGSMDPNEADQLDEIVSCSRMRTSRNLADRQRRLLGK